MPETDGDGAARKKAKTNQLEMPETDDGSDKEHADILYEYKYFYAKIPLEIRPFVIAAHTGDLDGLRRAFAKLECDIDNPMDIDDSIGEEDKTLLHLTCVHGHLACAQFLLERGASLEKFDVNRRTPMYYACQRGQIEMVQLFLTHAKEPESVKRMLQTIDKAWNTPLHVAAMFEHVDVIRLLLAHGASPTAKNFFWMTPIELTRRRDAWIILQEAVLAASYEFLPLTDEAMPETKQLEMPKTDDGSNKEHANILYKYKHYYAKIPLEIRPFIIAANSGDIDGLRRAFAKLDCDIDNPMDINDSMDRKDKTLLHLKPMDSIDEEDKTLLHLTCLHGHLTCAQFLLERGAGLEKFDVHGRTPLHYASQRGDIEMVQLFLTHAKEPECVKRMLETIDKGWNTPLHIAAMFKHVDVIRLLLARGASPTAKNIFRKTPIQLCQYGTDARIVLQEAMPAASNDKTAK